MRTLLLMAFCISTVAAQPKTELLWPSGAPLAIGEEDQDKPSITIHLADPAKANGTAVIVCPGGGYIRHAMDHEGKQVAEYLNNLGISAFVLKYRLGPRYRHPAPLLDAQRAIRTVRYRAGELHIAPDRVGILGFSAGGHLASTAGTHFDDGSGQAADPMDRVSSRPDFLVLGYPVISFLEYQHMGSRTSLLGSQPEEKLLEDLSNDRRVTPNTPPTFLFHTSEDTSVPPENSVLFYLALHRNKVPAEMHIFEKGRHGVGLAPDDPALSLWPTLLANWFRNHGLLSTTRK